MSISNLVSTASNDIVCKSIACPNLYAGEIRWVFYAPPQTIPANTGNGFAFSNYEEQPDSTGDSSQFNTTNGEWTCAKAGVYELDYSQSWNIGVSSGGYNRSFVIVSGGSGGARILCDVFENPVVGGLAGSAGSCRYRFEVGEKVAVKMANATPDDETMSCNVEIMFLRD